MWPFIQMSPEFFFPLSGDVSQNIEPDVDWFFGNISPNAGDQLIEKTVFTEVASYGKQLSLLNRLLLELIENNNFNLSKTSTKLNELKEIQAQVEQVKKTHASELEMQTRTQMTQFSDQDPEGFKRLLEEFSSK